MSRLEPEKEKGSLLDAHFAAGGGGFVDRVEDLLHGEGFGGDHVRLGLAEQAIDEVHHAIGVHEIGVWFEKFDYITLWRRAEEFERGQLQSGFGSEESGAVETIILGVFGPRGFEQDGATAFQFDQRDGEIIDIEWFLRVDLALAPAAVAEAAITEFCVSLATHCRHVEFAHQKQAAIQRVHTDIVSATAAGKLSLRKPGANARNAHAPGPASLGVINFAESAVGDELLGGLHFGREALVLADHEQAARLLGSGDETGSIAGIGRDGFIDHYVFTGTQGFDCYLRVEEIGEGDRNDVDIVACEQFLVIGLERGNVVSFSSFASALR